MPFRRRKTDPSLEILNRLSTDFLDFYHSHEYPLINTRDELSRIFIEFMRTTSTSTTTRNEPDNNEGEDWKTLRRKECLVVARFRQRKWMKSVNKSHSKQDRDQMGGTVIIKLVGKDRMTFPEYQEIQTVREQLRNQALEVQKDKGGVSLEILQDGILIQSSPTALSVTVGKESIFGFRLALLSQQQQDSTPTSPYSMVNVDSVKLCGQHSHKFSVHGTETLSNLAQLPLLLLSGKRPLVLEYRLEPPQSIGLIKVRFHVSFEKDDATYEICRNLSISSGNPEMERILQPTSPYKPRGPRHGGDGPKPKAIHWPEESSKSSKPFYIKLPQHAIPKETRWLIDSNEFSAFLDTFDWSPKTTVTTKPADGDESFKGDVNDYGKFWSQLLFASEEQSLLDIQMFDMENVKLEHAPQRMFALIVPGLAEGRPSVLRGDLINLTWNGQLFKGRVHSTQLLQVLLEVPVAFRNSFNPAYDRVERVRFTFSRTTYRTSHQACLEYANQCLGPQVLEPTVPMMEAHRTNDPPFVRNRLSFANRNLNPEQEEAIHRMVQGNGGSILPYILFGPPGTGKTTVVVETVYQLASRRLSNHEMRKKILLLAPSNDASDILVHRLSQFFPPKELVRVLAYSRRLEDLPMNLRPYAVQVGEVSTVEDITAARIVVSTVNLASRFLYMGVPRGHFHCVVVDEAGHATEPELIAVAASLMDRKGPTGSRSQQFILVGDPKQLGPITTSKVCEAYGFGISLLERLSQRQVYSKDPKSRAYPPDLVTKLVRNYRSHPSLLKLPNELYYDGELQNCGDVLSTHSLCRWEHLPKASFPIVFHSINGQNLREGNSPSWFNPEEAQQVAAYVDLLIRESRPPTAYEDIGIVTPYARQAEKIRAALAMKHPGNTIKVGSVETFQGQERRVIILSTVRSEPDLFFDHDIKYNLGFIAHPKRFNVAMTRAKALLIVVGCPSVLALDRENWLPFLMYCHEHGAWAGEEWEPTKNSANNNEEGAEDNYYYGGVVPNKNGGEPTLMNQESWDVVQAEEIFGYIHREE